MNYGITKKVALSYEDAVTRVTDELKKEEFGVLTSIDVKETLKKKIGVDIKKYVILGACNPPSAHKAIELEPDIGLFLPCNVIVYENKANETIVSAFNPELMHQVVPNNPGLAALGKEVKERLERVIKALP